MIAAVPASLTSLSPPTPAKLGTLKQKGVLLFMAGNTAKDKRDLYPQLINDYGFSKVVGKHTRGVDLILCYPDAASLDKLDQKQLNATATTYKLPVINYTDLPPLVPGAKKATGRVGKRAAPTKPAGSKKKAKSVELENNVADDMQPTQLYQASTPLITEPPTEHVTSSPDASVVVPFNQQQSNAMDVEVVDQTQGTEPEMPVILPAQLPVEVQKLLVETPATKLLTLEAEGVGDTISVPKVTDNLQQQPHVIEDCKSLEVEYAQQTQGKLISESVSTVTATAPPAPLLGTQKLTPVSEIVTQPS